MPRRILVTLGLVLAIGLLSATEEPLNPDERKLLESKVKAHVDAGIRFYDTGQYLKSVEAFEAAWKIDLRLYPASEFPDGHIRIAKDMSNLANVREAQTKFPEAEKLHQDSLAMVRKLYPKDKFPDGHAELVFALNNSALFLRRVGRASEASLFAREGLAIRRKLFPVSKFPDGHVDLANSLNTLGFVLAAEEKFAEAETVLREALVSYRKLFPAVRFPEGNAGLVRVLLNTARVAWDQSKYTEAEPLFEEAVAAARRAYPAARFPNGNPLVASILADASRALQAAGRNVDAARLAREALAMQRRLYPKSQFPAGHTDLLITLTHIGTALRANGKLTEAEELGREAIAMSRTLHPPERFARGHRSILTALTNHGLTLRQQGKYAESEPLVVEAVEMCRSLYPAKTHPDGHPDLLSALNNLGIVCSALEKHAEAEKAYLEAVQYAERAKPTPRHPAGRPEAAFCLMNLGACQRTLGRHEDAERHLRRALERAREQYPKDRFPAGHPLIAQCHYNLALALASAGSREAIEQNDSAIRMYRAFIEEYTDRASEGEALAFVTQVPRIRDAMIDAVRKKSLPADAVYSDYVWPWKGLVTRTADRRRLAARAASAGPEAAALLTTLTNLRRKRGDLLLAPAPFDAATRDKRADDLADLTRRIEQADAALRPLLPALDRAAASARATPADLQKQLPPDAVVVDITSYTTKDAAGYLAFLLTRDAVRAVDLGPATPIEDAVAAWRSAIIRGANADATGAKMRELVWAKLEAAFPKGTKSVHLSPDLALTRMPWAALPGAKAGTVLIEEYSVAVVPHAPFLLDQLQPRAANRNASALVIGGVAYDANVAKSAFATYGASVPIRTGQKLEWNPLPGAETEARGIAALAESSKLAPRLITAADATADRVVAELPKAKYAHFATHGFFADPSFRSVLQVDPKLFETRGDERVGLGALSPMVLSGLVFAGANQPATPGRGLVTGEALIDRDLSGLDLAVERVRGGARRSGGWRRGVQHSTRIPRGRLPRRDRQFVEGG